jgi:hypothetical protein
LLAIVALLLAGALVVASTGSSGNALAQSESQRTFTTTGWSVQGPFLGVWETGGMAAFGMPLSGELVEDGLIVQYFERARFQRDMDGSHVRVTTLGNAIAAEYDLLGHPAFDPAAPDASPACTFFPETGHNLCGGFRAYWEQFGGPGPHGYPISEEFSDPVTGRTVQYFERQRFEWQPGAWPARFDVLLGRLGAEYLATHRKPADAEHPAAGACGELEGDVVTITAHPDIPGPRCMFVRPDQRIEVVNATGEPVRAAISHYVVPLAQGEAVTLDAPAGSFLQPGVHFLSIAPRYHAELIVTAE